MLLKAMEQALHHSTQYLHCGLVDLYLLLLCTHLCILLRTFQQMQRDMKNSSEGILSSLQ